MRSSALFAERRLAAVTVVADAGIGKSRLLARVRGLGRCAARDASTSSAAGPRRRRRASRSACCATSSPGACRSPTTTASRRRERKIERASCRCSPHDDGAELAEGHAHLLGHLIGIEWRDSPHMRGILDDPRQIRNRAFHAAAQLFRRIGARRRHRRSCSQLEDLHWADDETLDFLDLPGRGRPRRAAAAARAARRPTLFERRATGATAASTGASTCSRSTGTRAALLADELLKQLPEVPAALRELVTGGAARGQRSIARPSPSWSTRTSAAGAGFIPAGGSTANDSARERTFGGSACASKPDPAVKEGVHGGNQGFPVLVR